jgi:hypothetical protein
MNDKKLSMKIQALTKQTSLDKTPRSSRSNRKEGFSNSPGKEIVRRATIDMPLSN